MNKHQYDQMIHDDQFTCPHCGKHQSKCGYQEELEFNGIKNGGCKYENN